MRKTWWARVRDGQAQLGTTVRLHAQKDQAEEGLEAGLEVNTGQQAQVGRETKH